MLRRAVELHLPPQPLAGAGRLRGGSDGYCRRRPVLLRASVSGCAGNCRGDAPHVRILGGYQLVFPVFPGLSRLGRRLCRCFYRAASAAVEAETARRDDYAACTAGEGAGDYAAFLPARRRGGHPLGGGRHERIGEFRWRELSGRNTSRLALS